MANNGCPFHYGGGRGPAPEEDEAYSMKVTYNGNTVCDSCAKLIDKGDGAFPRLYLDRAEKRIKPLPRLERVEIVGPDNAPEGGWGTVNKRFEQDGWTVARIRKDQDLVETDQHGVTRAYVLVELTREVE